ncbi:MAG: rod shape-determining protein MreC [Chloroflexi bacterium]|nr:MAG: rod shape-determining protein MreC [Chloroflexota bacterium]
MATSRLLASRTARRRTIAYAVLLSLSVAAMGISGTPPVTELQKAFGFAFKPLQSAVSGVANGVGSVVGAFVELDRLRARNEELERENQRLASENTRAVEIERQNKLLSDLLQLRSNIDFKTVPASVIAREDPNIEMTITIDRGTDAGLNAGDVVVAGGGAVVGRVTDANPASAHVLLINSVNSVVIGQLSGSSATGEVAGQLGGVLAMQNIDATETVNDGEAVLTAGIELKNGVRSPFPKGLLIGQVLDVQHNPNAVVQTAFVKPAIDLSKLEYVLVITNYEGGLPVPGQSPGGCAPTGVTLPAGEQPCSVATPTAAPNHSATPKP